MPPRDIARPGLALLRDAGRDYETRKFFELRESFGADLVHVGGDVVPNVPQDPTEPVERSFQQQNLIDVVDRLLPGNFVIEADFIVPARFKDIHGLTALEQRVIIPRGQHLHLAAVRPDIIAAIPPPAARRRVVDEIGNIIHISENDRRVGLRIIDVKLTAEPSPAYFGELAYYTMTLASWLIEHGKDGEFVVLADAAVWPGKHDASSMAEIERVLRAEEDRQPTLEEFRTAFERDLSKIEAEVFMSRIRRFFTEDLVTALEAEDWQTLPWHIDTRCNGCDYLGYRWTGTHEPHVNSCWVESQRTGHLSQVHGLTSGARRVLEESAIATVQELAVIAPADARLDTHQTLRAGRAVLTARAGALNGVPPNIPDRAGTSVVLPRFASVRIVIMAEFDVGSGITFAFGWKGSRLRTEGEVPTEAPGDVFVVRRKDVAEEGAQLRALFGRIVTYLMAANHIDPTASVQIYVWDRVTFEHLQRVVGRHLPLLLGQPPHGEPDLRQMTWLFPPDEVIKDPTYVGKTSPITIVGDVVRTLAALDVPHYYQILSVARSYYAPWTTQNGQPPAYAVNHFFMDPLSDHVPSERAHEIWRQVTRPIPHQTVEEQLRRTMQTKMSAILSVAGRLTEDLRPTLIAKAPPIGTLLNAPPFTPGICVDGEIWYQHQRLLSTTASYEVEIVRAMAPHEREARFRSVRLTGEIEGGDRRRILANYHLADDDRTHVFSIRRQSQAAKIKAGEFDWTLFDERRVNDLQPRKLGALRELAPDIPVNNDGWKSLVNMCAVEVMAVDPAREHIVVRTNDYEDRDLVREFLDHGVFDFHPRQPGEAVAILDPIHKEFFLPKFLNILKAIGKPPLALDSPLATDNIVRVRPRQRQGRTAATPIDRFLWDARALGQERTNVPAGTIGDIAVNVGLGLTPRQRIAVDHAAEHRLSLIWGPPGTGKSKTAVALVVAMVSRAVASGHRLRFLVSGPTWVAIDNVLAKIPELLAQLGIADRVHLVRLVSSDVNSLSADLRPYARKHDNADLARWLLDHQGITIVGGTPQQVANVVKSTTGLAQGSIFERVLIDEASQMDVAHAIMALSGLAADAALTVVGDDLQMAPIQQVDPPAGLETTVGSIYEFYHWYRGNRANAEVGIQPIMLDTNFRSNQDIVEFVREAGYEHDLHSQYPNLRLRFSEPLPAAMPAEWPAHIPWSEEFARILDPRESLVAVVSSDTMQSQMNVPEATVVAGLVATAWGRLWNRLDGEQTQTPEGPFEPADFFKYGMGIVTPHRAQQSAVVDSLRRALPNAPAGEIYAAVDTVERFQGQEKNIMIASFGLGDVDQIAIEEEFLYNLNRFNVIASRARAKFILFVSRTLVDHLPREVRIIRQSRLLKHFVDGFLRNERTVNLPPLAAPIRIRTR